MNRIFLDYAAGQNNPSSLHEEGKLAKKKLEEARKTVAEVLGCLPKEIIFTGSGTESINLALLGFARANKDKGNHIITSEVEHHAVLATAKQLEKEGFEVTYLNVDKNGVVNPTDLKNAIKPETILVSLMYVNNEVGAINDIKDLRKIAKGIVFHTDACQAPGYLSLTNLGVDLLSLSAQKFNGPKGVGILYKSKDVEIEPIIFGGGQEFGLRSGTENVQAIYETAIALKNADENREEETVRLTELRDYFITELEKIPQVTINGSKDNRIANNVNISIKGLEGEAVVIYLDKEGVAASTGAACSTSSITPSHVLLAMGKSEEEAKSAVRFTLGKETKKADLDETVAKLTKIVNLLSK